MDAVCGEAIKEGTCEIQEIPSTATPLELQEVNQPYCNLLPPSLAFWPTAYTLDELSSFFRLPILFDGENIEIKKETAPKLEQTGIYLGQTNNGLSAFIDASSFKNTLSYVVFPALVKLTPCCISLIAYGIIKANQG